MPIHQCTQHQHPSQPIAQNAAVSALLAIGALLAAELNFRPLEVNPACATLTHAEKQHPPSYGKARYIKSWHNDM